MKKIWLAVMGLAALTVGPALAQETDTCTATVQAALTAVDSACGTVESGQACLASSPASAEPLPGLSALPFAQSGDVVDTSQVQRLRLSGLDPAAGTWGAVLVKAGDQEPVTLLLFGDVTMTNQGAVALPTLAMTIRASANMRGGPGTNYSVVGAMRGGDTVTATGRLEDGSWFRITREDGTSGWVSATLIRTDGDPSTLAVVGPDDPMPGSSDYGPMQAFSFTGGFDVPACGGAPMSGILAQTAAGTTASLMVDGATLRLDGATVFLQAYYDAEGDYGELDVNVLAGSATLDAFGAAQTGQPGTTISVPIDADLAAFTTPDPIRPFDAAQVANLPVGHGGIEAVEIPAPATMDTLLAAQTPQSGTWTLTYGADGHYTCPDGSEETYDGAPSNGTRTLTTARDGSSVTLAPPDNSYEIGMTRGGIGTYTGTAAIPGGVTDNVTWQVGSPTEIAGTELLTFADGCTLTMPFTLAAG